MIHNKNFSLLWLVNILTTLAIELFTITVLVTIFEQTASTLQAAGTTVARALPSFLLGPVVGVLVDRLPRQKVLISMDIIRLLLVAVALLMLQTSPTIPVLGTYLILAGLATADAFHRPARLALIPALVPQAQLVQANSYIFATSQVILAISYTAGGWLIRIASLSQIVLSIVALFGLAIAAAFLIQVPQQASQTPTAVSQSIWAAFLSGWRYLQKHPLARPLTIMETIEHVPHGIWTSALMLAFTVQALNGNTADWGYQVTGYFTGMIIGSIAALTLSNWLSRHPGWLIVSTALLAGFLTLAFAASPTVLTAVFIAFLFGPPFALRDVAQDALLQATVIPDQLGRIYATRDMLRNVVFICSGLLFAWLSENHLPIRTIYILGGLIYILTGLYALSNKAIRQSHMQPTHP